MVDKRGLNLSFALHSNLRLMSKYKYMRLFFVLDVIFCMRFSGDPSVYDEHLAVKD